MLTPFRFLLVCAVVCIPTAIRAQETTPSHVFQVVETVRSTIAFYIDQNFGDADDGAEMDIERARKPRHVLAKAMLVSDQANMLRRINGLPPEARPVITIRAITPADVKTEVDRLLAQVSELGPRFGLGAALPAAAFVDGKAPVDVYRRLSQVGDMIYRLGVPRPVPNDVFRSVEALTGDLDALAATLGRSDRVFRDTNPGEWSPADLYEQGFQLIAGLRGFVTKYPALEPDGGILEPERRTGNITPSDVLDLVNGIRADIRAMRSAAGETGTAASAPVQSGRTPSDVYSRLLSIQIFIATL